jgi:hypothetical protein
MTVTTEYLAPAQYEAKFDALLAELGTGSQWQAFLMNPKPALAAAGIPLVDQTEDPDPVTAPGISGLTIQKKWWGQNWIMDEDLTNKIKDGIEGSGSLAAAIAAAAGIGTVLALPIAIAVISKVAVIKAVDHGYGVRWPISWFQWAMIAQAVPEGVAAVVAAAELALWPKGNKS